MENQYDLAVRLHIARLRDKHQCDLLTLKYLFHFYGRSAEILDKMIDEEFHSQGA